MDAVAFADARRRLAELAVDAETEPVFITRAGARTLVLMDAAEWASVTETAYLLSTEGNRRALTRSIEQAKTGQLVRIALDDL